MHDLSTFTAVILELKKSGYLELKVSEDRLQILINRYLTGQDI
jgi:hypothetical protein